MAITCPAMPVPSGRRISSSCPPPRSTRLHSSCFSASSMNSVAASAWSSELNRSITVRSSASTSRTEDSSVAISSTALKRSA